MFENFRDKCIEIYELDPTQSFSAPGLAWQSCLKKIGVKLELLTDNDMLWIVEERIEGGICQATRRYAKANKKYMKNYDKNTESLYLECLNGNNLYGYAMSEKLPVDGLKWMEKDDLLKFDENFIKNYDENSDTEYIREVDVEYPKSLHKLHSECTKLVSTVQDMLKNMLFIY